MSGHDAARSAAALSQDEVVLEIHGAVATITIERPAKINALRLATWQALRALIGIADRNPAVGLIVVRGAGGHFSAGNDISVLSTFPGRLADAQAFGAAWAEAIAAIEDASRPVIMAIQGVCYGSALAMSLGGDVRIASANAVFSIPVAKLGALYLRSDLQRLVATVGMGQSKKLLYTSETFGAEQALRIGLVDEVFAEACFEAELQRLVETMLTRSAFTLRRSKQMLRGLGHAGSWRETRESLAAFAEATQSEDFTEGISAFLSRRTARFRQAG
jgi:enoyl-CoA hydratase/carnithine racemase